MNRLGTKAETLRQLYQRLEYAEVLPQPMLVDVRICGVVFTLDPNMLGNYYVISVC